jgi:hypothetical protein
MITEIFLSTFWLKVAGIKKSSGWEDLLVVGFKQLVS